MEPQPVDVLDERAELVVPLGGEPRRISPGGTSPELDHWLTENGHETYVFVLEANLGKAAKVREKLPKAFAKGPAGEQRLRAELQVPGQPKVTGWFLPGAPRQRGRELAKALKTRSFLWARVGSALEVHDVKSLEDEFYELDDGNWNQLVKDGNRDLARSLVEVAERPQTLVEVMGGKAVHLWVYLLTLALIAVGGGLWLSSSSAEPRAEREVVEVEVGDAAEGADVAEDGEDRDRSDLNDKWGPVSVARRLLHPALLPALLIGWCLSRRRDRHRATRERTAEESEQAWRGFAPELSAAWLLALVGVLVISFARASATGGPTLDLAEDTGQWIIVCLWLLPAVAYAKDFGDLIGRMFSDFFGAVFAIFGLKLFLKLASWFNDLIWYFLKGVLPEAPDWLKFTFELVTTLGAEGLLLYLMFGYVWTLQRQRFLRWGSGEDETE